MLTMEEIDNISFRRSGLGGYKVEDVDTFVDGVIEKVRQLELSNKELEARVEQLNKQIVQYEAKAGAVQDALITAEATAKKLVRDAAIEADAVKREAQAQADKVLTEAQKQSSAMLSSSEIRSQTVLNSALSRSAAGIDENNRTLERQKQHILQLQTEVTRFRDALIDSYKEHLRLINSLPRAEEFHRYQERMEENYPAQTPVRPEEVERAVQEEADKAVEDAKKERQIHVEMVAPEKVRAISEEIRTNRQAQTILAKETAVSAASLEDTIELPKLPLMGEDDSADSNLDDIRAAVRQEQAESAEEEPKPASIDEMMFGGAPEEAPPEGASAQDEPAETPAEELPRRQPIVSGKKK